MRYFFFFCTYQSVGVLKARVEEGGSNKMYDTQTRVRLVKSRVHKKRFRQTNRASTCLSTLCVILFSLLIGTTGAATGQPQIIAQGMYGSILLHENAGGYVLVGVVSFTIAVILTVICFKRKENRSKKA